MLGLTPAEMSRPMLKGAQTGSSSWRASALLLNYDMLTFSRRPGAFRNVRALGDARAPSSSRYQVLCRISRGVPGIVEVRADVQTYHRFPGGQACPRKPRSQNFAQLAPEQQNRSSCEALPNGAVLSNAYRTSLRRCMRRPPPRCLTLDVGNFRETHLRPIRPELAQNNPEFGRASRKLDSTHPHWAGLALDWADATAKWVEPAAKAVK